MKVKEFKDLVLNAFSDEDDECEIVVPVNGYPMDIMGITNHGHYTKPGGLPYEIVIN